MTQADEALAGGDFATASAIFGQVLAHEPQNAAAIGGLAKCHALAGDVAEAKKILARATGDLAKHAAIAAARTAIELAEEGQKGLAQVSEFRARLARDPKDHQARLDLATALYGGGQRKRPSTSCWNSTASAAPGTKRRRAGSWSNSSKPSAPPTPLTISGRKRLSSMMFS
jgi:putative thioredoxin